MPDDEGAIEYENGEREDGAPPLAWEIGGEIIKAPNSKIIVYEALTEAAMSHYGAYPYFIIRILTRYCLSPRRQRPLNLFAKVPLSRRHALRV